MVLVVMTLNRIVWRRLYSFTTERFRLITDRVWAMLI